MPFKIDPTTGKQIFIDARTGQPIQTADQGGSFQNNQSSNTVSQPQQPGVFQQVADAFVKPAVRYGEMVGEGFGQGVRQLLNKAEYDDLNRKVSSGKATEAEAKRFEKLNAPIFMKEQDLAKFSDPTSAVVETAKRTAGGASYAIPGGGSVGSRILAGAGSSALSTFSQDNATVGDVATSALAGGATTGLFEGLGALVGGLGKTKAFNKVGDLLKKRGEDVKIGQYTKAIGGVPLKSEGGKKLLSKMREIGIRPGDVDTIVTQSDELIANFSPVIREQMDALTEKGVKVDATKLISDLEKKMSKKMIASDKARLQTIVDDVKSFAGDDMNITPSEFYDLKQRMGKLGKWNNNASADDLARGELWKDLYIKANEMTDEVLKSNGFEDFRKINEIIHTATNASSYAERMGNKAPSANSIGLLDTIAGASGFAVGGVPGVMGGYAVRKAMNSAKAGEVAGNLLNKAGDVVSGASLPSVNVPQMAKNVLNVGIGSSVVNPENQGNSTYNKSDNSAGNQSFNHNNQSIPQNLPEPTPIYTPERIYEAMLLATMNGDSESYKSLSTLYDLTVKEQERRAKSSQGKASAQQTAKQAVGQLRTLFGRGNASNVGTGADLALAGKGSVTERAGAKIAKSTNKVFDPEYQNDLEIFQNQASLTLGLFTQAFGSGTPQDAEAKRLMESIPGAETPDKVAKAWFDNLESLLNKANMQIVMSQTEN